MTLSVMCNPLIAVEGPCEWTERREVSASAEQTRPNLSCLFSSLPLKAREREMCLVLTFV